MINSSNRKLCLSGWLLENNRAAYDNPLKMQKFLFLYECFSKINGEKADFSHLKGYKRGPVFSNVWGDYTKESSAFKEMAKETYNNDKNKLDFSRIIRSSFIVSALNEEDLSELTHSLNIWNCKRDRILSGEYQVVLSENDFNRDDESVMKSLESMFPIEMIKESTVLTMGSVCFVLKKNDLPRLTESHMDILGVLSESSELHNPVYIDIDTEGGLCVD